MGSICLLATLCLFAQGAQGISANTTINPFPEKCVFCLDGLSDPDVRVPNSVNCRMTLTYANTLFESDSNCADIQEFQEVCCPVATSTAEGDEVIDLKSQWAEYKNGFIKNITILQSTGALVSMVASSLLIWILGKSSSHFSTTYHRLLLGLSISDILLSLSFVHFNAMIPKDLNYMLWNARGNQATCTAVGFFYVLGVAASSVYMCSLHIYHLVRVKHYGSDSQILAKMEPFLHGIPISLSLIASIPGLVLNMYNVHGGLCISSVYNPPHCVGYEDGEVPEGFTIPCGRGYKNSLTIPIWHIWTFIIITPLIIATCIGLIYKAVRQYEKLIPRDSQNVLSNARRSVMKTTLAYAVSYFLTWGPSLVTVVFALSGVWTSFGDIPSALIYFYCTTAPLQGVYTLTIYMYPRMMCTRATPSI